MNDDPVRDALAADDPPGPMTPEVAVAHAELVAARQQLGLALDELTSATQSALDVPAKIRRNPMKTAAIAGGAGFLLLGGPRRALRFALSRVRPPARDPYAGLLPDEIEAVLRDSGLAADPEVRRALEADFAEYLRRKGRTEPTPTASASFWRTFDRVAGPLGSVGARLLVERLMAADRGRGRVGASEPGAVPANGKPRSGAGRGPTAGKP
jgi:hypothetical protein